MAGATLDSDLTVRGTFIVTAGNQVVLPSGVITAANLVAAAGIATSKLDHRHAKQFMLVPGTAIVATTQDIHICRATGTLIAVEAAITGTLADDASRHAYVDLHKSTSGGAFATMLTAPIDLTSSSTIRTLVAAALASTTLADGDILRVIITVAGGSGNQGQGLVVTVTLDEAYA